MTDIRTHLAEPIRQVLEWVYGPKGSGEAADAVLDALLSLPGIAIVELPEPTKEVVSL